MLLFIIMPHFMLRSQLNERDCTQFFLFLYLNFPVIIYYTLQNLPLITNDKQTTAIESVI